MKSFRKPLGLTVALLALAGAAPACLGAAAERPLNVIVIMADDMGWGDLGVYGHPYARTPAVDRLARTGCVFEEFYVTSPVCSPSRAGFNTGRIQNRFGMQGLINAGARDIPAFHHVPVDEPSLPRALREAGFATAHIGKWHISFVANPGEPGPAEYGYDHGLLLGNYEFGRQYLDSKWLNDGARVQTTGRWSAEIYVDDAIRFIERSGDRPFFINLWSYAPHQEVGCAPRFRALYADRTEPEQHYYGTITQQDEEYGRLLDYLDRTGLAERTIVIFTSDNGAAPHLAPGSEHNRGSNGGLRGAKHTLYEGGIRVPGIVRWPGLTRAGSRSRQPAWTPDVFATLAAAYGLRLPDGRPLDGVDLRPALRGEPLGRRAPLYWQYPFGVNLRTGVRYHSPGLALRDGGWKLHCDAQFGSVELYNLATDPTEQWNMKDVHADIAARLQDRIREMHAAVNGPYSRTARFLNPAIPSGKNLRPGPWLEFEEARSASDVR